MLRWNNPMFVPRRYFYDIGGGRITSTDIRALYALAVTKGESRPFLEWKELMVHKMCLEMPPNACDGDVGTDKYRKQLTLDDLKNFIHACIAVAKAGLRGEPVYASQPEADRRAEICAACRDNTSVTCGGCTGIIALANLFILGRTVKRQAELGACRICGCWIPAKIWCSKQVLERLVKPGTDYPENCWNREAQNADPI